MSSEDIETNLPMVLKLFLLSTAISMKNVGNATMENSTTGILSKVANDMPAKKKMYRGSDKWTIGKLHQTLDETVVEWKILDFFNLPGKLGMFFNSPVFTFSDACWSLWIYPYGRTVECKDHVALYLLLKGKHYYPITCCLKVKEVKGIEITFTDVIRKHRGNGYRKFCRYSELKEKESSLLPPGVVTIQCILKREGQRLVRDMSSRRPTTPHPVFRRKNCARSKKDEIAQYCREMLAKSMLTGVPQIVSAPTTRSKFFKTFVLLASITGFLYQTSIFLVMYRSYPTLVDVQITRPPFIDLPAITICNRNGLRRLEYCRMKPENCEYLNDTGKFCEQYPESCKNGVIKGGNMYPKIEFVAEEGDASQDLMSKAGHRTYPLVSLCQFQEVNVTFDFCKNDTFQPYLFEDLYGKKKQCYILNALWTKAALNLPQVPTRAVLKMIIDLEPDQYFRIDRIVAGQLAVHSPWTIPNPFTEGLTINPRKVYLIRIKEEIKNLLPYPYQTNCTDYIENWRIRGLNGPLSKEMCVEECILNQTMEHCQCVLTSNLYPHNFRFCAKSDMCHDKVNFTFCHVKCNPACHSRHFDFRVQEENALLGMEEESAKLQNWNRTVILLFNFKRTQVNVYRYRAKYESIEFYSFMGGFVGIWLGVSLIAVFDFLESMATFFVFLFDIFKSTQRVAAIRSAIRRSSAEIPRAFRSNSTFSNDSMRWAKHDQNSNKCMVNHGHRILCKP